MQETQFDSWVRKICWRRDRLPTPKLLGFPAMRETWVLSWVGKIPWRRERLPTPVFWGFPYGSAGKESACNAKSQTRLSAFTFTFHFHALKEMATHSSVLAWRILGTVEPGGLPSMGSHRVGHDWSNLAAAAAAMTWVQSLGWEDPPDTIDS